MPNLCLSSLKRGKIILLLLMLMLLGFLFLMNQERERKIIYKGAAGEEKEAFLARGAYESLEENRKVKLPEEQSKTAEEKQEGLENQKIEDSVEVESQENLKGSKKAKKEDNSEISKGESQEESKEDSEEESKAGSKAEIGEDGGKKDAGIADSREEIQQNQKEKKININTATEQELESLKGIGPATAKNIIRYREEYGGFSSIEEIKNVKRIGEKIFEKIKADICV